MSSAFYLQTLLASTAILLSLLRQSNPDFMSSFYFSGGTALSLQLGHRESEDLDFLVNSLSSLKLLNNNF